MAKVTQKQLSEFASFVEALSHLPLVDRVHMFVQHLHVLGVEGAFARPAHYLATASGSASAASYSLELVLRDGILLIAEIEHPSDGTADIICSQITSGGNRYVEADAVMDAWCDALTSEDPRALPWPIVLGAADTLTITVTGSSLNTTGIKVFGLQVDDITAEVFRFVGELCVEGFNKTHSAAVVMAHTIERKFDKDKEFTHLVAKETLTGDAARSAVDVIIKQQRLMPKSQAVIPAKSIRKASSRMSAGVAVNDTVEVYSRYTSAAGTGVGKLQVTMIGRRRYRQADVA